MSSRRLQYSRPVKRKNLARLEPGSKQQIRFIADRFHVGTPDRELLKTFFKRMQGKGYRRSLRRAVYAYALRVHGENRGLYRYVMRGGR